MAGLYIHVPFCKQSCYYCDFHFSTNLSYRSRMVSALTRELELQHNFFENETINTIYFGGGTPSILSTADIAKLLNATSTNFTLGVQPEITLEANPDDLTFEKLKELKSLGINRLSIGIQSFHDEILKYINRAHTAAEAIRAFEMARTVGFDNISIDLIFSFPGSVLSILENDIFQALKLQPEHISVYHLTVEEKTVFGNWQKKGKLHQLGEEEAAYQFEHLIELLVTGGYQQYEVSNFCRDGFYSKHNASYWMNIPYLGIGPGAHSYRSTGRQYNVAHNHRYITAIESGTVPAEMETTDNKSLANDYILSSLRTMWGCDIQLLSLHFGYDISTIHKNRIEQYVANGLMLSDGKRLILTNKGLFVADAIVADLLWG